MYIIIEGCYSDWHIEGYVETEEEALAICAKHNTDTRHDSFDSWYYEEVKPFTNIPNVEGCYTYEVVFKPDKSLSSVRLWSSFPVLAAPPAFIREDKYCYLVHVYAKQDCPTEKIAKIAKDFLMEVLAKKELYGDLY